MRGLGQNPTEQDLKEMIDDVDLDADGLVKFDVRAATTAGRGSPRAPPPQIGPGLRSPSPHNRQAPLPPSSRCRDHARVRMARRAACRHTDARGRPPAAALLPCCGVRAGLQEFCHLMLRQMEGNQDQEQALREAFKVRAARPRAASWPKPVLHACSTFCAQNGTGLQCSGASV